MSTKDYEIKFSIAGGVGKDFLSSFKKAAEVTKGTEETVKRFNREAAKIDGLLKQTQAAQTLSSQYFRQKAALENLNSAISRSKTPNAFMIQESQRLTGAVSRTKSQLDAEKSSLMKLRKELNAAGLSTDQLVKRKRELARQAGAYAKIAQIEAKQNQRRANLSYARDNAVSSMMAVSTLGREAFNFASSPVKQAMQMEDAMAEIKKVVDFSEPDGLQKMQAALEKMSLTIPMTADGLAKITAAAGQAGIAEKDLLRFTETAAKMGVAFDITAEEAGEMMAKWRSGMNLTQEEAENLANATNALSNNNAALAKQVGEALKRYGALGKVAGLTETQTAAMAATIIGAGAEAEVAATGMNAFMRTLTKGGSMTDLQKAAFGNIGFDALQLQKDIQKDAPKTIFAVLDAIKTKLPKELQMQYLTAMFGEEGARAMGPMLANTDKLRENFELVANSEKYAGSMLNEFRSRCETTSNAFTLASNAASYFVRAVGQPFLKPLKEMALGFVGAGESIGNWAKENQGFVSAAVKLSGAILGGTAAFHLLRMAVFAIKAPFSAACSAWLSANKAITLIRNSQIAATVSTRTFALATKAGSLAMAGMKASAAALGTALKFMFLNPVGIAITAVGSLVLAGIYLYKNWDEIKAKLAGLWTSFNEKFPGMASIVKSMYDSTVNSIEGIKTEFRGILTFVTGAFSGDWSKAWEGAKTAFSGAFQALPNFAKGPLNLVISLANKAIAGLNSLGSFKIPDMVPGVGGKSVGINIPQIPMLASGGIATAPSLAMVGEGREPEAILPLSKLSGMMPSPSASSISVTFSPVINVTGAGGGVREQVQQGLKSGAEDLKRELERLMNAQRRVSYA